MLLPDEENLPVWLRAELATQREHLGTNPRIEALREACRRLSPHARTYLRELAVRAIVVEEALRMLASGELADVCFTEPDTPGDQATPTEPPEGLA